MDTIEKKMENLDNRILHITENIKELEQQKISLMMLKRELHFDLLTRDLKGSFDELSEEHKIMIRSEVK
tara:strand:- start:75 stop:281 length:207 start_codon:yes stop_codon:yes gene_type:complete